MMNLEIHDELDDLEDFDLPEPTYEVWAACYTDGKKESLVDQLMYTSADPDDAITFADSLTSREILSSSLPLAQKVTSITVEVETTVDDGSAAGAIYRRQVEVDAREFFEVSVDEKDLEFNDDGLLFLRKVIYPVGANLKVSVYDPTHACARTIIYKVVGQGTNGVLCEFAE